MLRFGKNLRNTHTGDSVLEKDRADNSRRDGEPGTVAPSKSTVSDEVVSPEASAGPGAGEGHAPEQAVTSALIEPLEEAVKRLETELAEWKDRALRAAADLENFRKRALRERDEALHRGAGDVLARIVDVIDDLARVAHLDPATTDASALHEGMLAIERKFLAVLSQAGLERIEPLGERFDPQVCEAVATVPAVEVSQDHTVAQVYQNGYRYRGVLLRPARVAVYQWPGEPEPTT